MPASPLRPHYVFLALIAVVLTIAASLFPKLIKAGQVNAWSLEYLGRNMADGRAKETLPVPPEGHARAAVWLARGALVSGEPELALTILAPMAKSASLDVLRLRGQALAATGDFGGAVSAWLQARDFWSLMDAGRTAQDEGRGEDALLAFRSALNLDPEEAVLPMANFLWVHMNDIGGAEALLRLALVRQPSSRLRSVWLSRIGDALRAQDRWDEAENAYDQALRVNPDNWQAEIGLGWVFYAQSDDPQVAMAEFREAINAAPGRGEGYYAMGQLLSKEGRYGDADAFYQKAIEVDPAARWWYMARAEAARKMGELALALDIYKEVSTRFPEFAHAYYEMAWAYRLNEQPAEATQAIQSALVLMGDPTAAYYARAGQVYEWIGRTDLARNAYLKALSIDPENYSARQGLSRLEDQSEGAQGRHGRPLGTRMIVKAWLP